MKLQENMITIRGNHSKSLKIPWKTTENGANARNKPWKIPWKMEEAGANARRKL